MQVWWRTHLSFWHYVNGRYDESAAVIAEARAIAERYGLEAYLFEIDHAEASALVSKGDYAAAKARLRGDGAAACRRRAAWIGPISITCARCSSSGSGTSAAAVAGRRAGGRARPRDRPAVAADAALPRAPRAQPHRGRRSRRRHARAGRGDRDGVGVERKTFEQQRELRADRRRHRRRRNAARSRAPRRRAGRLPRRAGSSCSCATARTSPRGSPTSRSQHGIETEFVRTLIERNALAAPADAAPAWPFRLRIRALGGFELVRDGAADALHRQGAAAPARSAEAAGGAGRQRRRQPAADRRAVAGRRRRGGEDLVRHDALSPAQAPRRRQRARARRRQALARPLARVDRRVGARGRVRRRATACGEPTAPDASPARAARRLLDAYPGPLLGAEEHAVDRQAARRAARALRAHADARWASARARTATGRPPSTSTGAGSKPTTSPSRSIAGSCAALAATGDQAEALNAFRRCRELLSIVLGVKPSAETDQLYREIAAGRVPVSRS